MSSSPRALIGVTPNASLARGSLGLGGASLFTFIKRANTGSDSTASM